MSIDENPVDEVISESGGEPEAIPTTEAGEASVGDHEPSRAELVEELNRLIERVQAYSPEYEPPSYSPKRLLEVLGENVHNLAPGLTEKIRSGLSSDLFDPDTWKGLWFMLNYTTVTVRIDGTNNVLTEAAEWTAATDNDTTASSLATAIAALSGAGATASGAVVTVTADSTTTGLFLSTNADAAYLSVTNSSRFWVIGGGAWESFDGVTWIQGNGITTAVQGIFYRQGTYYLVGVNKVFYSPRADVSTSRNWYEVDHPVDFSASCAEPITGIDSLGPITVIGTYLTPEDYYYWTDNGSRFFEIPKPDPPTNNTLEMWDVKWTGTFAVALATDQVETG